MALISKPIPNLFNGVSQQAATLRHVTQCEVMDNCYPSIATGTRKRPPTKHKAKLTSTLAADAYVHIINRSTTERYVVVLTDESVEVFDALTGAQHTVTFPDGTAYLSTGSPLEDFVALTVKDYTFISNRTVVTAMTADVVAGAIAGTMQQFSGLPGSPAANAIYKIEGTPDTNFDNYFVQWDGSVWVECAEPGSIYKLDAATMPWKLIPTGATTWECRKNTWDDRQVGNDDSNPLPSFIGRGIADMFFYRNRLGFISDESVVLSRSGKPFNMFAESATAVLDTDPVDYSVSNNKVSVLNHAVPFNKALMLFSDQTQFQLISGDVLTPSTPKADPVTEFESAKLCRPVSSGNAMFFAVSRENSTALREYFVEQETVSNDAADITAHVPTYIPKDAYKLSAFTSEDALLILTLEESNHVYLYKYYWGKEEKVQSAWGRLVFDAGDMILGCDFIGNIAFFVIQRDDGIYLEQMEFEANRTDGNLGFLVHLDRRVDLTGVYDPVTDVTTWTLPYEDMGTFQVVLGDAFGEDAGNSLTTTRLTADTIEATGDWSAGDCYVGRAYTMRYRFSTIYLRDDKGVAVTNGKLKLRRMFVNFANTGYLRAEVTPRARSMYTYEFTGKSVGSTVIGEVSIESGTFQFPVGCENTDATIDLVSDSYLPCFLQSAEWLGEFTMKAARP